MPSLISIADCSCCTSGFPSLEQLLSADTDRNAVFLVNTTLQGIFPTLRFTCDGNLTQLIYRTIPGGSPYGESERFGLWRLSSTNSTVLLRVSLRENEILFRNVSSAVKLYSIDLNIPVQVNDHLGHAVIQPSTLQFLNVENDTKSKYYFERNFLSKAVLESEDIQPYMPLITAVISRMCCLNSVLMQLALNSELAN